MYADFDGTLHTSETFANIQSIHFSSANIRVEEIRKLGTE